MNLCRQLLLLLLLTFSTPFSELYAAPPATVLFISPAHADDLFWQQVEATMRHAARGLGLSLQVSYGNDSPLRAASLAHKAMSRQHKPAFIVLQFNGPVMPELLRHAERQQVRLLTINSQQSELSRQQIGIPGQTYPLWLAHLWPDDQLAGRLEAEALLQAAKTRWPEQPVVSLLAFNGAINDVSLVAQQRSQGMRQALRGQPDAALAQEFAEYWNVEKATHPLTAALQRYPEATVLWSANDAFALRLRERLKQAGKPLDAYLLAGIDATPQGLAAVERGELVTTIGGHFMEGAWAMVLIYDYLHLPAAQWQPVYQQTGMHAFDREQISLLRRITESGALAKLDYRAMTRTAFLAKHSSRTQWQGYPFTWQALLATLQQQQLLTP